MIEVAFIVSWENYGETTRLVNMDTFGNPMSNPLDVIEDKAEEDKVF